MQHDYLERVSCNDNLLPRSHLTFHPGKSKELCRMTKSTSNRIRTHILSTPRTLKFNFFFVLLLEFGLLNRLTWSKYSDKPNWWWILFQCQVTKNRFMNKAGLPKAHRLVQTSQAGAKNVSYARIMFSCVVLHSLSVLSYSHILVFVVEVICLLSTRYLHLHTCIKRQKTIKW